MLVSLSYVCLHVLVVYYESKLMLTHSLHTYKLYRGYTLQLINVSLLLNVVIHAVATLPVVYGKRYRAGGAFILGLRTRPAVRSRL